MAIFGLYLRTMNAQLVGIEDNLLRWLPDLDIDLHGALKAKSTTELQIVD